MEYALTADHHRVHALDAEKGQEYYCPVCGNQVIPRQGEVNSWHFAHVTSCVDDWTYDMSEWHRNWQNRFPESTREVVIEYKGESHRADILTGGYVIEFQHSPLLQRSLNGATFFIREPDIKSSGCLMKLKPMRMSTLLAVEITATSLFGNGPIVLLRRWSPSSHRMLQ